MKSPTEPVMPSEVTGIGKPVVLVPGGLTGWLSWKPHAERLASTFTVLRVQLLSVEYGLRGVPLPSGYSVRTESRALELALDAHEIQLADFSGWSYGGLALLDFALNHPDRVRSLTLIEPPAFWVLQSRGPLGPDALDFQRVAQRFDPVDVTEDQLVRFAHFAGFVPENVDPRSLPQWPVWMQHRQSLRTGDVPFRHVDDLSRVKQFDKPILLFKGVGSPRYLREIIDILGQEFPHARVEELLGAHALPIVSIDRYLELFVQFVGE
jgi:pimeloyl-ACP methyl ester carboxylesterase